MEKHYLSDNKKAKKVLKTLGWIFFPIGAFLLILSLVDFFASGFPSFPALPFIALPLIFLGVVCLMFGYMKEVNKYVANETAPVAADVTNYMLDETRDEVQKTVSGIASSVSPKEIICPSCGVVNEKNVRFCDHCGKPLIKICPKCQEENDADSTYCRKCGERLD